MATSRPRLPPKCPPGGSISTGTWRGCCSNANGRRLARAGRGHGDTSGPSDGWSGVRDGAGGGVLGCGARGVGRMGAADVVLGEGVVIFQPGLVDLYGCAIGDRTRLGAFVEIQKGASVGSDAKISSHTFICEGV